jgi:L-lactate dehydrogenase (cytochrome)
VDHTDRQGKVYDVTSFLPNHPGGPEIIIVSRNPIRRVVTDQQQNAGKDATKIFAPLHPPDALDLLSEEQHLGPVDPTTMPAPEHVGPTEEEKKRDEERQNMPTADAMLLIDDFEYWAEKVLSGTAWNYYKSAADREISTLPLLPLKYANK